MEKITNINYKMGARTVKKVKYLANNYQQGDGGWFLQPPPGAGSCCLQPPLAVLSFGVILHRHIPVHPQQAHDMPGDSGRCADGESELESKVTGGVAADRLAPT